MGSSSTAQHLRGPWIAVLADGDGDVYDTFGDALEVLGPDHPDEITIRVVRGSAMPGERLDGYDFRILPGSYQTGDVVLDLNDVWLVDPDDASVGAEARYLQAQAMAAGLNAATTKDGE